LENGRDPWSQFRIFIRKVRKITLAVEHCRYPLAAWQSCHRQPDESYPGRITGRLNVEDGRSPL
jgi:hypothetical protein